MIIGVFILCFLFAVGVSFVHICCSLWILGKCHGFGYICRECFCRLVGGREEKDCASIQKKMERLWGSGPHEEAKLPENWTFPMKDYIK